MSEFPPDEPRLRIILSWIEQQQARHQVIGTYLQVQRQQVEKAIAAAEEQRRPAGAEYRLQHLRGAVPRSVLHRSECWIGEGMEISRREALMAVDDPQIAGGLEMCDACRPEDGLR